MLRRILGMLTQVFHPNVFELFQAIFVDSRTQFEVVMLTGFLNPFSVLLVQKTRPTLEAGYSSQYLRVLKQWHCSSHCTKPYRTFTASWQCLMKLSTCSSRQRRVRFSLFADRRAGWQATQLQRHINHVLTLNDSAKTTTTTVNTTMVMDIGRFICIFYNTVVVVVSETQRCR